MEEYEDLIAQDLFRGKFFIFSNVIIFFKMLQKKLQSREMFKLIQIPQFVILNCWFEKVFFQILWKSRLVTFPSHLKKIRSILLRF